MSASISRRTSSIFAFRTSPSQGSRSYHSFGSGSYRASSLLVELVSRTHAPGRPRWSPKRSLPRPLSRVPRHDRRSAMYAKVRHTRCPGKGNGCTSSSRTAYRHLSVSHRVTRRNRLPTGCRSAHRSVLLSLVGHGTHKNHKCACNAYALWSGHPTCCRNSRANGRSTGGNWSWRHGSSARSLQRTS